MARTRSASGRVRPQAKKPGKRPNGGKRPGGGRWASGPLQCSVCQHPERSRIDWLLASGASHTATAEQFGLPRQNIDAHFRKHVSERYKQMAAASHLSTFEEMLKNATEANSETVDLLNILIRGHMQRWGANLEVGADQNMNHHSNRIAHLIELRSKITLELQQPQNLKINNYLVRDAASLVSVLRNNPDAVAQVERWYEDRMNSKLIEHAETQGSAD